MLEIKCWHLTWAGPKIDVFFLEIKRPSQDFHGSNGNKEGLYLGSVLKKINQQI